jgi:hypothetical protein
MTIKQQGGIFGRNPTFNNLDVDGLSNFNNTVRIARSAGTLLELYDADGGQEASKFSVTNGGRDMTIFAPQDIIFTQDGLETARFLDGGGLTFNGDTAAANALDDYEEGTWTPTGCGAGPIGVYTKMGDTVFAYCEVKANSVSTDTIGGLPFTVGSGNSAIGGYFGRARFAGIFDANGNEVRIRMLGTDIKFMNNGGLAGDAAATITTAAGGVVQLAISLIYKV